ncbi:MAG: MlaD family protein [Flavobacteriaceae bacterium]|nr:MlaD family protein [Flavobacteriaceae bacterium]
MKVSRELKTGVAAIVIIVLFVWGFNFLKNQSVYDTTRTFYVEYADVQGLIEGAPVTISGLSIGKVSNISFHPDKKGVLTVRLSITNNISFSNKSIVQIYSPDFLSGKSLRIILNNDNSELALDGDILRGTIDLGILDDLGNQVGPLTSKLEGFVTNTDSLMMGLTGLLDEENQKNLKLSLENFKNLSFKIDRLLESNNSKIDSVLGGANHAMLNLSKMMDSLNSAGLGVTVIKLQTTLSNLNKILDNVQNGDGTIGKLINDEKLYNNLEAASKELKELLHDFKLHPKRYVNVSVFGKKEKPYKKGKEE